MKRKPLLFELGKPRLTKHARGWKCALGWRQCVSDTPAAAYARWVELNRECWNSPLRSVQR